MNAQSALTPRPARAVNRLRLFGFALGVLLLIAAGWSIARQGDAMRTALRSLAEAPIHLIALAAVLPLVSLLLTSLTFWLLTSRFGRVGKGEMFALIGAAWLLNYLPLWPGMFGRLAYHRAVNNIPITSSATALVWANVIAGVASLTIGVCTMAVSLFFPGDDWRLALCVALPALAASCLSRYARWRRDLPDPHLWRLFGVYAIRLVEVQVWAARYAVCFALVGVPIAWGAALALAAATQLATLLPIGGNALGWREWVTGLIAPLLPVGLSLTASIGTHAGLTAELLNRAIEIALAIPLGIVCAAWVARRLGRAEKIKAPPPFPATPQKTAP